MVQCSSFNCTSRSDRGDTAHFYKFPSDLKRRNEWLAKLKREGFVVTEHSRLCHKHFEPECFTVDPRIANSIGFAPKSWILKKDAVATIFNYETTSPSNLSAVVTPKRKRSDSAVRKRRRLELLKDLSINIENNERRKLKGKRKMTNTITVESSDTAQQQFENVCCKQTECVEAQVVETVPPFSDQIVTFLPAKTGNSTHADEDVNTQLEKCVGTDVEKFSVATQTTYGLVSRRSVKTEANITTVNGKSRGVQVKPDLQTTASQTRKYSDRRKNVEKENFETFESILDSDFDGFDDKDDDDDPDWHPDCEDDEIECNIESDQDLNNPHKELKFIVFQSSLKELLDICPQCGKNAMGHSSRIIGTMLTVNSVCSCGYTRLWNSQPSLGSMPCGNLILAAGIFFSGSSPVKALHSFRNANIMSISLRTYNLIQSNYLVPTVISNWNLQQTIMFEQYRRSGNILKLGGDARCSSPGHTAKYGSYTLMDVQASKIVDIQLVQSNEVKNSTAMELEGLKRSLSHLKDERIQVSDLITDRHVQVKKYMREQQKEINHWFDVWHVAKGVYKKLEAKGKKKGLVGLKSWSRSVSNHLYWCAASSGGNGEMVQQKWKSIVNHVANVHSGHGDIFTQCQHGPLGVRSWLKKGSKAHKEMESIVCRKLLVKDIQKLSPAEQTSSLESFHKIVCYFAPKSGHYFYEQMKARLCLAALHFNANSSRVQATKKDGELQYSISFPKGRRGAAIVKPIKVRQNFDYIDELMEDLLLRRDVHPSHRRARIARDAEIGQTPPPVSKRYDSVNKADLIDAHTKRFTV